MSQMDLPEGVRPDSDWKEYLDHLASQHVIQTIEKIQQGSQAISRQIKEGRLAIIGAMYDVTSGKVHFLDETNAGSGLNIEKQS